MASSSRARAAVIVSGILVATPAGAQSSDTPSPPPAAQAAPPAQDKQDKPPPVQVRPMSMQPDAMTQQPQRRAPTKRAVAPRKAKRGHTPPPIDGAPVAGAPNFFRLDGGATRISLEVTTKVDVAESAAQGRLVYHLRGARVVERVNLLPLLTGYFPTPVDRAQLMQDDQGVTLIIDLREATTPTHRVVETPRGMVLQIDFPRTTTGERQGEVVETSRERAKRRTKTQSLGADKGDGGGSSDE